MTIRKIPPRSDGSVAPGGIYKTLNAPRGKWEDLRARTAKAIGELLPTQVRHNRRNTLASSTPPKPFVYLGEKRNSEPDFRQYFKDAR